jgi:putative addiction module CopG family antidote
MNISLSPQMTRFIRGKVKAGEYTDASEVVRDAVRRQARICGRFRTTGLRKLVRHIRAAPKY